MSRSPQRAVAEHLEQAQRPASCISGLFVAPDRPRNASSAPRFRLNRELPVVLRRNLSLAAGWTVVPILGGQDGWRVRMAWYEFAVFGDADRELLVFHLHPGGNSRVQTPHLHIRPLAPEDQALLRRAHLPTPELSFADIVRFAIVERGVEPRRQDWERLLAE